MNIAIVGYGKMGKMVRQAAISAGHTVTSIIDPFIDDIIISGKTAEEIDVEHTDVAIDFSIPSAVAGNMRFYAEAGVSAVIGTTGWYDMLSEVRSELSALGCSVIVSGNFSLGVAVLMKAAGYLSALMNGIDSYDVAISEVHHRMKKDSPSATALMLKDIIMENMDRKKRVLFGNSDGMISPDELQLSSMRLGSTVGEHAVIFDSDADTIELRHTARSRNGFAEGAVRAASWIYGRKGFFTMDDFISDYLGV